MYTELIATFSPTVPYLPANTHTYYSSHWTQFWPGDLPPVLATNSSASLSRWTLFKLGSQITDPDSALNFYAAVSAWGAGTAVRSVYRACKPVANADFAERLYTAVTDTRELEPVEAYRTWKNQIQLPYLGPSQFTKLMYFASRNPLYDCGELPLILDGRIARALGWSQVAGWSPQTYGTYLDTLAEIARQWGPSVTAEDVECQLTELGIKQVTHAARKSVQLAA